MGAVTKQDVDRHIRQVHKRIQEALADRRILQKAIQMDSGLTPAAISLIRNGKNRPSLESLIRIAMALRKNGYKKADPNWLLGFREMEHGELDAGAVPGVPGEGKGCGSLQNAQPEDSVQRADV